MSPHASLSFRISKHLLAGISGEAMFFPAFSKNESGLAGIYYGGGIHLQHNY